MAPTAVVFWTSGTDLTMANKTLLRPAHCITAMSGDPLTMPTRACTISATAKNWKRPAKFDRCELISIISANMSTSTWSCAYKLSLQLPRKHLIMNALSTHEKFDKTQQSNQLFGTSCTKTGIHFGFPSYIFAARVCNFKIAQSGPKFALFLKKLVARWKHSAFGGSKLVSLPVHSLDSYTFFLV